MRKSIIWLTVLLTLIGIVPYGIGWHTQKQVMGILQENEKNGPFQYQVEYHLGWLKSRAKVKLYSSDPSSDNAPPPLITFEETIEHGPLVRTKDFSWRWALSLFHGQIHVDHFPNPIEHEAVIMPQGLAILKAHSEGFEAGTHTMMPALHTSLWDLSANRSFEPDLIHWDLKLPHVNWGTDWALENVNATGEIQLQSPSNWEQKTTLNIQSASWNRQVQGPGFYELEIKKLDLPLVTQFFTLLQNQNELHSDPKKLDGILKEFYLTFFNEHPEMKCTINQSTFQGPIQFESQVTWPQEAKISTPKDNALLLLSRLIKSAKANLHLSFPSALFIENYHRLNIPSSPHVEEIPDGLSEGEKIYRNLVTQGWLNEKQKQADLVLEYEDNKLIVNHNPKLDTPFNTFTKKQPDQP